MVGGNPKVYVVPADGTAAVLANDGTDLVDQDGRPERDVWWARGYTRPDVSAASSGAAQAVRRDVAVAVPVAEKEDRCQQDAAQDAR